VVAGVPFERVEEPVGKSMAAEAGYHVEPLQLSEPAVLELNTADADQPVPDARPDQMHGPGL
jgi:hypothetical protein